MSVILVLIKIQVISDEYIRLLRLTDLLMFKFQSVPKTTSPMPLSSNNWFGLVKMA